MKILAKYVLIGFLLTPFTKSVAQTEDQLYGSWVKTKMERIDGQLTSSISKRDSAYIKFTFKDNRKLFFSTIFNELGAENIYILRGNIIDVGFNKYRIEGISAKNLTLIEYENGEETSNSVRIYFINEDQYLNNKSLLGNDLLNIGNDTTYIENEKVFPLFYKTETPSLDAYLLSKVEGLSNHQETFFYATFKISSTGKISDIVIHHHVNKAYDSKMTKAIQSTQGYWINAKINQRPVNVITSTNIASLGGHPTPKIINGKIRMDYTWLFYPEEYRSDFIAASQLYIRGKYQEALDVFTKCAEMTRDPSSAHYEMSKCYEKLGNTLKSRLYLDQLESTPLEYLMKQPKEQIEKN